jgi:hypothetical protein
MKLHGPFNRHVAANLDQQMHMIGHHDEIMELEFARRHIGAQHINQQRRITFRVEQGLDRPSKSEPELVLVQGRPRLTGEVQKEIVRI